MDEQLARIHQRIDEMSITVASHIAREEPATKALLEAITDLKIKVEEMHKVHTQAKGALRLIIALASITPIAIAVYSWVKDHVKL